MKTIILLGLLALGITGGASVNTTTAAQVTCDHYYVMEIINGVLCIVEYDCDGKIVEINPIRD